MHVRCELRQARAFSKIELSDGGKKNKNENKKSISVIRVF